MLPKQVRLVFSPFLFQVQYEKKLIIGGIEQFQEQQNEENIYFAYLRFDYGNSMANGVPYQINLLARSFAE